MALRNLLLGLISLALASAQTPAGATLTLVPKNGRKQFRQGEPIELELEFRSSRRGHYGVWTRFTDRIARQADYDRFTVEPSAGTVDPLADSYLQSGVHGYVGPPQSPALLDGNVVTVDLYLNEWISFRQPGHYRVSVESTRLDIGPALKSEPIEITIVPPEPGWADARLEEATALLQVPERPRTGTAEEAARTLRFLETPAAARALAQYLDWAPASAQAQLRAGLAGTPYRREAVQALEEAVAAPDVPITSGVADSLCKFAELAALGIPPVSSAVGREEAGRWVRQVALPYRQRAQPIDDAVRVKIFATLAHKRGEVLAISLATLGLRALPLWLLEAQIV